MGIKNLIIFEIIKCMIHLLKQILNSYNLKQHISYMY